MRTLPCIVLYAAFSVLAAMPTAAAPITWADPAGLCAGNLPCFTTLGDAVANAGPAPAQVFVFPGTYAESLDLGTMGSALPGGNPGQLAIVSVDAGGQPAPGAVIDPGAPSGPGSGDAIFATAFPAPLTLDGLEVRSPDLNGIFLTGGTTSVRLLGVDASGSPMGNGAVVANSSGTVEVIDSTARLNFNAGFNLASQSGLVVVSGTLAERNDGAGFSIVGRSATITDSQSEANGQDGWLIIPPSSSGSLTLTNVLSRNNAGPGLFSINFNPDDQYAVVTATGLTLQNNGNQGAVLFGFNVTLNQLTTEDNGGAGLSLGGETVAIQQFRSARNGDSGAFIGVTDQITIQGADIEGNLDGGLGVLASDGQTATASATNLVATGNVGTGIAFAGLQDARFATVDIVNATAVDNTEGGIGALAHIATATQITVTNNVSMGFTLDGTELADASFVTSSGHSAGIVVGAEQEARLRDSEASNNISGLLMGGSRAVIERVTATMNGPGNGNLGSGTGFAFINAETLDVRDSRSEANEIGWTFLEIQTDIPSPVADALSALGIRPPEELFGAARSSGSLGRGTLAPQDIRIETSRTIANTQASVVALLREDARFRVSCSDFVGNGPSGLELLSANTIDARGNYWGAASGPTHPGNPTGAGDLITDSLSGGDGIVQWDPFLAGPATADDCPVTPIVEVPTLPSTGLALLALLLTGSGLVLLRRRRRN